jgi:hypothetical protein
MGWMVSSDVACFGMFVGVISLSSGQRTCHPKIIDGNSSTALLNVSTSIDRTSSSQVGSFAQMSPFCVGMDLEGTG